MKKQLLATLAILALVMSGCFFCGPGDGNVFGYIVDQGDYGVAGVIVTMGTYGSTVTDSTGRFAFATVPAGSYTITASGGESGHYLIEPVIRNVTNGDNDLGRIPAYEVLGFGAIVESLSSRAGLRTATGHADLKSAIHHEAASRHLGPIPGAVARGYRPAEESVLADNISFFHLSWAPLAEGWISHYVIHYLGPDGSQNELVWDSNDLHAEDPGYVDSDPAAYLDLTYELTGLVSTAGTYQFRITGYSADDSQSKALPAITVSLGMLLDNFPTDLQFAGTLLSWTGVIGADGYRAGIFAGDDMDLSGPAIWDSGDTLLPPSPTYVDVSAVLIVDTYYYSSVIARALDETGWTAEVTRGISGFVYTVL